MPDVFNFSLTEIHFAPLLGIRAKVKLYGNSYGTHLIPLKCTTIIKYRYWTYLQVSQSEVRVIFGQFLICHNSIILIWFLSQHFIFQYTFILRLHLPV